MTIVNIPSISGEPGVAKGYVRLVNSDSVPIVALVDDTSDVFYAYAKYVGDLSSPSTVDLLPQSEILTKIGEESWYEMLVKTQQATERWNFMVSDDAGPLDLLDLIEAGDLGSPSNFADRVISTDADNTLTVGTDGKLYVDPVTGLQVGDNASGLGSGSAADGYVLTADGLGGTDWEAPAGGAGSASDVSVSATPENYTADSANVEGHLAGIDDALIEVRIEVSADVTYTVGTGMDFETLPEALAFVQKRYTTNGAWISLALLDETFTLPVVPEAGSVEIADTQLWIYAASYDKTNCIITFDAAQTGYPSMFAAKLGAYVEIDYVTLDGEAGGWTGAKTNAGGLRAKPGSTVHVGDCTLNNLRTGLVLEKQAAGYSQYTLFTNPALYSYSYAVDALRGSYHEAWGDTIENRSHGYLAEGGARIAIGSGGGYDPTFTNVTAHFTPGLDEGPTDAGSQIYTWDYPEAHYDITSIGGLPTYADNSAALAGGLSAGDLYKTATGELRIVV